MPPGAEGAGAVVASLSPLPPDRWLMRGVGGHASAGTRGDDISAAAMAAGGWTADVSNRGGLADLPGRNGGQKQAERADSGLRPSRPGGLNKWLVSGGAFE